VWRLYVDTYNHLTQRYGDELIERNEAGLSELLANRPDDVTEPEITPISRRCRTVPPRVPREAIYRHIWLARDIKPDEVHIIARAKGAIWGLAVATLDSRFSSRTSAACCRRSDEHPARPCVHQPPTDSCSMRSSSRTKSGFSS